MIESNLFNALRGLNGPLSQIQVDSVNAILDACKRYGINDNRQISYVLSTVFHESGLKPAIEVGLGSGRDYGKKFKMGGGLGKRVPYTTPDKLYYGRGFVQITWYENYEKFSKLLGIDLLNRPELALQTDYAAEIAAIGMSKGSFTGVNLNRYFNDKTTDTINARRIINGTDKAELIAGYYNQILKSF